MHNQDENQINSTWVTYAVHIFRNLDQNNNDHIGNNDYLHRNKAYLHEWFLVIVHKLDDNGILIKVL